MKITISIRYQTLIFTHRNVKLKYPVSTSKFGEGFEPGSNKTPLGMHIVCEKIGEDAEYGMIFKDRKPTGTIAEIGQSEEDVITSRILRLKGLQTRNSNTFDRYIYIHGTSDEASIGKKASIGCIRMKNDDIINLFEHVDQGCKVHIRKE
ncbi:MAG: L,D-transpeptidase [Candidatus Delongbacteria bacterium]|nr:L,D-transpeptidase [Candidatus Delongbacteria bacterium]